jgi:adenylate kinase
VNLILLGPQGSGKGTQAELLSKEFGLQHLEMGRILRSVAVSDNEHAAAIRETLTTGKLVPDEYTRLVAWDFISKHHPKTNGFLFEGYPRSLSQYEHLKDMLAKFGRRIDAVVNIEISEPETIKRLSARRTCIKCGEIFNITTRPSTVDGVCDLCGGELRQREDDTPDAIRRRLAIYREQTRAVFAQANTEHIGCEVDGEKPIEVVYKEILLALETMGVMGV